MEDGGVSWPPPPAEYSSLLCMIQFHYEPKYFEETDSAVDPSFFLENNLGIRIDSVSVSKMWITINVFPEV